MPRSPTTGDFVRVSNSFSQPVYGTVIDPTDADSLFNDYDTGLTFNDASPLILVGSTSGVMPVYAADTVASGASFTFPHNDGTVDYVLRTDGNGVSTWVAQSSPITIGSTVISGGTTTRIL